eukprot:CAMPEP_0170738302 /NCGR_PEP_ID=MMETSP0437-20130122/4576_1 /TAXON_ID=0 /ORGANISM="Sexangularia sp." /LENGTH=842 /DNA_ID=CAMNT_0011076723 /DNA_START=207 /DNA_END=2735 /DNA_ORIENTATION=-
MIKRRSSITSKPSTHSQASGSSTPDLVRRARRAAEKERAARESETPTPTVSVSRSSPSVPASSSPLPSTTSASSLSASSASPTPPPSFCTQCGTGLRPTDKFCAGCGSPATPPPPVVNRTAVVKEEVVKEEVVKTESVKEDAGATDAGATDPAAKDVVVKESVPTIPVVKEITGLALSGGVEPMVLASPRVRALKGSGSSGMASPRTGGSRLRRKDTIAPASRPPLGAGGHSRNHIPPMHDARTAVRRKVKPLPSVPTTTSGRRKALPAVPAPKRAPPVVASPSPASSSDAAPVELPPRLTLTSSAESGASAAPPPPTLAAPAPPSELSPSDVDDSSLFVLGPNGARWDMFDDDSGSYYYHCESAGVDGEGVSVWLPPDESRSGDWVVLYLEGQGPADEEPAFYFANEATGETTWEVPEAWGDPRAVVTVTEEDGIDKALLAEVDARLAAEESTLTAVRKMKQLYGQEGKREARRAVAKVEAKQGALLATLRALRGDVLSGNTPELPPSVTMPTPAELAAIGESKGMFRGLARKVTGSSGDKDATNGTTRTKKRLSLRRKSSAILPSAETAAAAASVGTTSPAGAGRPNTIRSWARHKEGTVRGAADLSDYAERYRASSVTASSSTTSGYESLSLEEATAALDDARLRLFRLRDMRAQFSVVYATAPGQLDTVDSEIAEMEIVATQLMARLGISSSDVGHARPAEPTTPSPSRHEDYGTIGVPMSMAGGSDGGDGGGGIRLPEGTEEVYSLTVIDLAVALFDFEPQNEGELGVVAGEALDVLEDHGEWTYVRRRVGDAKGEEGYVASSYLDRVTNHGDEAFPLGDSYSSLPAAAGRAPPILY